MKNLFSLLFLSLISLNAQSATCPKTIWDPGHPACLAEAAQTGDRIAQFRLGQLLIGSKEYDFLPYKIQTNYLKGREWIRIAAELGHKGAAEILRYLPEVEPSFICDGTLSIYSYLRKDLEAAKYCLQFLAERGDVIAQFKLAQIYLGEPEHDKELASGFETNFLAGYSWMKRAAEGGHGAAQSVLGKLLLESQANGLNTLPDFNFPTNCIEGRDWIKKAETATADFERARSERPWRAERRG